TLRGLIETNAPRAAYVGASNDDRPEFYAIFQAAMENVRITDCRMIPSEPTAEDVEFVRGADVILLAGGDPLKGWRTLERNGLRGLITERYFEGAVLAGVSAGAAQLGLCVWSEDGGGGGELANTFGLVPFIVGAHEEKEGWRGLRAALRRAASRFTALGIQSGAGALYHADHTLEAVRKPLEELSLEEGQVKVSLIYPPGEGGRERENVEEVPLVC
ncbi:MAG TPA: Type 1 glutamine amidotransferase-like domain-containing protein, partial [Pyrinomonadaceae bacterium]|nr:Type 1 glutamine amidotransferase-like domain-containing protein [Pyrinomonadaceae bacterium]